MISIVRCRSTAGKAVVLSLRVEVAAEAIEIRATRRELDQLV
jgi:hypothetical protein